MERFSLQSDVVAEINELGTGGDERNVWTEDEIKNITELSRHHGVSGAVREWNKLHPTKKVGYGSAHRWHKHWSSTHEYYKPKQRGCTFILPTSLEEEVIGAFKLARKGGNQVDAPLVCAIARGIVKKHKLGLTLAKEGGKYLFSDSWGRSFLHRHHAAVFGATTTRCNTAEEIVQAAGRYYADVKSVNSSPQNTYNMDEFFALLSGQTRRWTWHFVGQKAQIPLREAKGGFTASILSCADGSLPLMQIIWKGKTSNVHAQVEKQHPRITETQHIFRIQRRSESG